MLEAAGVWPNAAGAKACGLTGVAANAPRRVQSRCTRSPYSLGKYCPTPYQCASICRKRFFAHPHKGLQRPHQAATGYFRFGCDAAKPLLARERGSAHQANAERYGTYGWEITPIRSGAMVHLPGRYFELAWRWSI